MRVWFLPKVDWYVVRSVLVLFFMCAFALCFLVAVVDAFERVDEFKDFAEREHFGVLATSWLALRYYFYLTPQYFVQYMVPFVSMLAGVFVVSMMSSHREFTALRASGVPLQRVLLPVVLTAVALGLGVYLMRDSVLPALARGAHATANRLRPRRGKPVTVVIRHGDQVHTYTMGHFDPIERVAYNFRLEVRNLEDWRAGKMDVVEIYTDLDAKLVGSEWRLGLEPRHVLRDRYQEKALPEGPIATPVTPAMLEQQTIGAAVLTRDDLVALAADRGKRVELARRQASPLSGAAILLVAMSLLMRHERVNPGSRIGRVKSMLYAILVCTAHYAVGGLMLGAAEAGQLPPLLAAWLPNLSFGLWGGISFWRVNL